MKTDAFNYNALMNSNTATPGNVNRLSMAAYVMLGHNVVLFNIGIRTGPVNRMLHWILKRILPRCSTPACLFSDLRMPATYDNLIPSEKQPVASCRFAKTSR